VINKGSKTTQVRDQNMIFCVRRDLRLRLAASDCLQISKVIVDVFVWFGGTDDETMMAIHNGVQ
jgi:hypothetical protein